MRPDDLSEMQKSLALWRDNDQQLAPALQSNPLLQEAAPLSQTLSTVAIAGLKALEYLNAGSRVPAERPCKVATKDCVPCHMPKLGPPAAHFKFTDHFIRVVKSNEVYPN